MRRRGSILARDNKNGTRTYYIKYSVDGRPVKRAVGSSRRDAERTLIAALAAVDRGAARPPSRQTFAELADAWLERKRPRIEPATYRDYEIHVRRRLKPAFGQLRLQQITRAKVETYLAALDASGELSRKTINDSLIPLRQILGRAVREGTITTNPAASTDPDQALKLPYERPAMHYLNGNQALQYIAACSGWYRPLAEVLIGGGLRVGEAIALEWRDVDWDGFSLNVVRAAKPEGNGTPKGDRGRRVMLASYLIDMLSDLRPPDPAATELVFTSPNGFRLNRDNVRRRGHQRAVRAAGLSPQLRLHDLRHTAATLWLSAGESIYFVQQQLGHRDIQTTIDLYGHPDQHAHRRAAEKTAATWRNAA